MKHSVVIFDDEPWSREAVKSLVHWDRLGLELAGQADDGIAGLNLVRSVRPDIAITDMRMPGMEGDELLRRLADARPEMKILVMSGYDDYSYVRQALRSRAQDYLLKPIDPDELNRALERCIAELEADGESLPYSFRAPAALSDPGLLDEYVAHRRRAFGYLLEFNADGVRQTLDSLKHVFEQADSVAVDEELGSRIVHDFLLMLEEFVVHHGVLPDPVLFRPRNLELADPDDVFQKIIRVFDTAMELVRERLGRHDQLNLAEVKDHLDRFYCEPISLHSVAQMFLVTKEHLAREFRKAYGETLNEYITRRRMETARELIRTGRQEIKQAAFMVGYDDVPYFYRVFKKQFGISPAQARETEQTDQDHAMEDTNIRQ